MQPFQPGSAPQAPFEPQPSTPPEVPSVEPPVMPSQGTQWLPPAPPAVPASRSDRRWLRPIAATAAIFVVLTIAVSALVLIPNGGTSAPSKGGSPEAVVMAWWQAERSGNVDLANSYLTDAAQAIGNSDMYGMLSGVDASLTIQSSSIAGDRATVRATVSMNLGVSLPGMTTDLPLTFTLVMQDGSWKIDDIQPSPSF